PAKQTIFVRPRTSDLKCLEKVFLSEEYKIPFEESLHLIVDAGANIGMATLYFSVRNPNAHIVAIEPERSNFEILKLNCGHLKNVVLIEAALWFDRQSLAISDASVEKWAFTVTDRTLQTINEVRTSSITIEEIMRQMAVAQIDLLKLDIEGSEK